MKEESINLGENNYPKDTKFGRFPFIRSQRSD